jgi:MerR family transcriptional regulator, copper efflux regulator
MATTTEKRHHLPIAGQTAAAPAGAGEKDPELLHVGDLASRSGKTVRAIHLYEQLGLLRPHARSKAHYRIFGADAVVRVRWIVKLQELGFSLSTIQAVVREWEASPTAPGAMARMREIYREKLAATRDQIGRLRALEAELAESLGYLETCDTCDPARIFAACTCCELHDDKREPDLVAGFRAT